MDFMNDSVKDGLVLRYRNAKELAQDIGMDPAVVRRVLRLGMLSPRVVEGALEAAGPDTSLQALVVREIPVVWAEQAGQVKALTQKKETMTRDVAAKKMNMNRLMDVIESGEVKDDGHLTDRYNLLMQEVKEGEAELTQVDHELTKAQTHIADREVVAQTMASLGEVLDKAKLDEIKPLLPYFVQSVEVTEEYAKIGIFERPHRSEYSITSILGNAAREGKDDDDLPPSFYLTPTSPDDNNGGSAGSRLPGSPSQSGPSTGSGKGSNVTVNSGKNPSPSGASNLQTAVHGVSNRLSACGLEPI